MDAIAELLLSQYRNHDGHDKPGPIAPVVLAVADRVRELHDHIEGCEECESE